MKMDNGSFWGQTVSKDRERTAPYKCHICVSCKRVVTRSGVWEEPDYTVLSNPAYSVSSVVCLHCLKRHFPNEYETIFPSKIVN